MPELAEVEHFRREWDPGLKKPVIRVAAHEKARIFRGVKVKALEKTLIGAKLTSSEARGKQMVFRFDRAWLGVHLGMTGDLRIEAKDYEPKKSDHLVLYLKTQALVFSDPRMFGRVQFHEGKDEPDWWKKLAPEIVSKEFTKEAVADFLRRRKTAPIKAILLMQERFPGIGNWMADEILWRAKIHPSTHGGKLTPEQTDLIWKITRELCRQALTLIGKKWQDPPDSWLFNHRWSSHRSADPTCPRCGVELKRAEIGGRTTCWCPRCQGK